MAFALGNKVHAQDTLRVYANAEQHGNTAILASVQNPNFANNAPYTDYSTLSVTLGAANLIYANQNLRFAITGKKPTQTTPVFAKFSSNATLALLSNIKLQTTNNNTEVGISYNVSLLLNLLGLLNPADSIFRFPPQNNITYDGIQLTLNATLSLALNAKYYYAFFIIAPTTNNPTICSGTAATLTITNFQSGYIYKLYSSDSTLVDSSITNTISTPVLTTTGSTLTKSYYLVAFENGIYDSGQTPVTVTVYPKPVGIISATSPICEGEATQLQFNATAGTAPYSLIINGTTYNNISNGTPFNTNPNATATTTYSLTKITDNNNCTNP